jgi:hypothetical protein
VPAASTEERWVGQPVGSKAAPPAAWTEAHWVAGTAAEATEAAGKAGEMEEGEREGKRAACTEVETAEMKEAGC